MICRHCRKPISLIGDLWCKRWVHDEGFFVYCHPNLANGHVAEPALKAVR